MDLAYLLFFFFFFFSSLFSFFLYFFPSQARIIGNVKVFTRSLILAFLNFIFYFFCQVSSLKIMSFEVDSRNPVF